MNLSIIIVSFNVKNYLRDCLKSIFATTNGITFEVFVVDNNSSDGSAEMVQAEFPDVHLLKNNKNVGFVRANNMAISKSKGRVVLLLNPDTEIIRNSLDKLIHDLETEPGIGAVGCKMLNTDLTLQPSCYHFPSLKEIFGLYFLGSRVFSPFKKMSYERKREVDFVRGAFMAMKRDCLEEIGLLDENFFMFGEETDLCLRMKQAGWKVLYSPETVILHHRGKSSEQQKDEQYTQRIRSLLYFFKKHYGKFQWITLRSIIFTGIGLRILFRKIIELRNRLTGKKTISTQTQIEILRMTLGRIK